MDTLKSKIFFILLLSAIFIGGIGYYSITHLFQLTGRISLLSQPNKKWELFREITSNLHKLNDQFYSQSLNPSETFEDNHLALMDSITEDIGSLRTIYESEQHLSKIAGLDTIPILLTQIKTEFEELKAVQEKKQQEVLESLEDELLTKLDSFSTKDSLHIINRISLEVRNRNLPDSAFFYHERIPGGDERRGFFKRLFSKARPTVKTETKVVQSYKTISDTIVHVTPDTVLIEQKEQLPSEEHLSGVIKEAFSNYYQKELDLLEKVKESEISLYRKSAKITTDLEKLINDLRFEENQLSQEQASHTVGHAKNFQNVIIWVLVVFATLSLLLVLIVIRDINKNREYQLQILNNEEKAKREAVAKQEFLTTMSHELRTPLTSIIGYAELLEDSDPKLKSIKSSSLHLLNVANEILDSAKIESGIIETKEEIFDLKELLEQIRDNTVQMITSAGLEPRFDLPKQPMYVETDSYRIQQVIYNLVHNAIKFTYKGFVELKVSVNEDEGIFATKIDVTDSGIGIHDSNIDKIFDNYQQIGTYKNKSQGIGLGLGLVKKVVQQMDGNIAVTSKIGEGSTFHLFLPLKKSQTTVSKEDNISFQKDLFAGKKIYCLDDDPLITSLYEMILRGYGAKIRTENFPKNALKHLSANTNEYDLVITDIKMPEMTGDELLEQLIASKNRPQKIIASTANVLLNEKDKEDLAQFDAYISKPILKQHLLKTVSQVLGIEWISSDSRKTVQVIEEKMFDIDDLVSFTMNDNDMLKEVLIELHQGTDSMLKDALKSLAEKEHNVLAEIIHKLNSRFAQIKVKEIVNAKQLEKALLNNENKWIEAEKLLTYWGEVNFQFGNFLKKEFSP